MAPLLWARASRERKVTDFKTVMIHALIRALVIWLYVAVIYGWQAFLMRDNWIFTTIN